MNWVDWVIIALLAGSTFSGFRQGFILEVATLLGSVAAFAVARQEYPDVRHILSPIAGSSQWLTVVSYLLVFLVVWGAIIFLARRLRRLAHLFGFGLVDRLGGAAIGFLQGLLVVELLLYLGERIPAAGLRHDVKHAALTPTFLQLIPLLHQWFPHV
jgi:membrane protein required for colicin V production